MRKFHLSSNEMYSNFIFLLIIKRCSISAFPTKSMLPSTLSPPHWSYSSFFVVREYSLFKINTFVKKNKMIYFIFDRHAMCFMFWKIIRFQIKNLSWMIALIFYKQKKKNFPFSFSSWTFQNFVSVVINMNFFLFLFKWNGR